MSVLGLKPSFPDKQEAPSLGRDSRDDATGGQKHDRIPVEEQISGKMAASAGTPGPDISAAQKMISATWGSILTSLLVTPLDVVRVRLQSQTSISVPNPSKFSAYSTTFKHLPPDLGVTACCRDVFWVGDNAQFCLVGGSPTASATGATECVAEETQRKTFTSTYDGLKKIARNDGALSLWRGLSPTLVMAVPSNVIYFTGYDWLRFNNASPINQIISDAYAPLVAGSVARVAAAIVVSPIEMFRTRMQATSGSNGVFRSTLAGLHQMTQTRGYGSLWRGLTLTMWRDVPFSGFYWWGYEAVRNQLTDARERTGGRTVDPDRSLTRRRSQSKGNHTTTFVDSFIAGATSGAVAAFITTPFDVGKTRQQVYHHLGDGLTTSATISTSSAKGAKVIPEQLPMLKFLYHIFQEEGASGLFKGWAARCLKVAPACAIMISSYEVGKRWARSMNERSEEKRNLA